MNFFLKAIEISLVIIFKRTLNRSSDRRKSRNLNYYATRKMVEKKARVSKTENFEFRLENF